ncbi:DUF6492 family protein [Moraxella canis]|uniref:Uncharacterized protein n=1 Tax=Moraxella canis TaxID=90239 RepID=A0A1S9ZLC2_9GAMM|nr:DUF6492 family protein [Moraxella canis]OOR83861.1 hypothetical protein B0180_05285 [Moraxella canis]
MSEMSEKTSFVTITYQNDLRMVLLQLISVDRLFDIKALEEYFIIINDKNTHLEEELRNKTQLFLSEALFSKLRFISSHHLLSKRDFEKSDGQRSQQILKMIIASKIKTKTYILLDAKNFFIKKADLALFIDRDSGKYTTNFSQLGDNWRDYVKNSFKAIECDEDIEDKIIPTITPYVIETNIMIQLLKYLQPRIGNDLSKLFESFHGKITEFFLYYAFLYKYNLLAKYKHKPIICRTLFAIYPSNYADVDKMIKNLKEDNIYLLGLHRKRLAQLSVEHTEIINLLLNEILIFPWERLDWFIDPKNQSTI